MPYHGFKIIIRAETEAHFQIKDKSNPVAGKMVCNAIHNLSTWAVHLLVTTLRRNIPWRSVYPPRLYTLVPTLLRGNAYSDALCAFPEEDDAEHLKIRSNAEHWNERSGERLQVQSARR